MDYIKKKGNYKFMGVMTACLAMPYQHSGLILSCDFSIKTIALAVPIYFLLLSKLHAVSPHVLVELGTIDESVPHSSPHSPHSTKNVASCWRFIQISFNQSMLARHSYETVNWIIQLIGKMQTGW